MENPKFETHPVVQIVPEGKQQLWYDNGKQNVPVYKSEMNLYFNEFAYHQAIQALNFGDNADIKKREAIAIRDDLHKELSKNKDVNARRDEDVTKFGYMAYASKKDLMLALGTVMEQRGHNFDAERVSNAYDNSLLTFRDMTMGGPTRKHYMPLSPYSPDLRNRECSLNAGNRIMLADVDDLHAYISTAESKRPGDYPHITHALRNGIPMYAAPYGLNKASGVDKKTDDGKPHIMKCLRPPYKNTSSMSAWNVGPSYTKSDRSGLSMMRLLMDDKNYAEVANFVNQGTEGAGLYADNKSLKRSFEVIRRLQEQGVVGKFECDRRPGQLKYVIPLHAGRTEALSGSDNLELRVIDPYKPSMMGARAYMGGTIYRFSTDRQSDDGNRSKNDVYDNPTVEDCVKMVNFVRGESVATIDDATLVGKPGVTKNMGRGKYKEAFINSSYISSSGARPRVSTFGPLLDDKGQDTGYHVMLRADTDNTPLREYVDTPEAGERYLRNAIDDAKKGLREELNVDGLIAQYEAVANEPNLNEYEPTFSSNKVIASIQSKYWSVLTGENANLSKLDVSRVNEFDSETDANMDAFTESNSGEYEGTQVDKIKAHARDLESAMIGQFEPDEHGKRFNAANIANYMGGNGSYTNSTTMISAMQACGIDYNELKGNDFYNQAIGDRMIQFDEESAKPINDPSLSPWIRARGETILNALNHGSCVNRSDLLPRSGPNSKGLYLPGDYVDIGRENKALASKEKALQAVDPLASMDISKELKSRKAAQSKRMKGFENFWDGCEVTPEAVQIDKNGVVRYDVCRIERRGFSDAMLNPVQGYIGQLMPPDKDGVIRTNFAASKNYDFIPVSQATVVPDLYSDGKSKSLMDRFRITDYDRFIDQAIEATIARDVGSRISSYMGSTTNLNNAVRHMQSRRYEIGELDKLPEDQASAIKNTKFVRMSSTIVNGSNQDTIYQAERKGDDYDRLDDMRVDVMTITGNRDMMQLYQDYAGYLDIKYTGLAASQGKHLALADGATVDRNGKINPVTDSNGKPIDSPCPLTKYLEEEHCCNFDMGDRENMGASAILQGKNHMVANIAMIPIGGWSYEDQVVMSKNFAERLGVQTIGDKVSDYHGNKGVTGLVIDPNMDPEEAKAKGLQDVVAWFKANDGSDGREPLDVIQNMGSAFSRNNGGLYREVISRGSFDLKSPTSTIYPGGIGKLDIVRMEQTAEHKGSDLTVEEEDSHIGARTSRNDGAQAGWAHMANNRWDAMSKVGRRNGRAWEDAREYLNLLNVDFDETGNIHFGIKDHEGEKKPCFSTQELQRDSMGRVLNRKMLDEFGLYAERQGGYIEIPFPIKFPDSKSKDGVISAGETPQISDDERSAESLANYPGPVYRLPLLSANLRAGQDYNDETVRFHDYTMYYQRILTNAYQYRAAVTDINNGYDAKGNTLDDKSKSDMRDRMSLAQRDAQSAYDLITNDVITHKINGKHNMFRSTLLSAPRQAITLVSVHDPRLPAGVSSMSNEAAKAIGFSERDINRSQRKHYTPDSIDSMMKKAEHAPFRTVTRDPVIIYTGESAERFVLDDREAEGGGSYVIAGNTAVSGTQKQKDHDGDTEAVFSCDKSDLRLMGQETRMLNLAEYDDKTGNYKLFYEKSQDLAIGWAVDSSRKDSYDKLVDEVNKSEAERRKLDAKYADLEIRRNRGEITDDEFNVEHEKLAPSIAASDKTRYEQLGKISKHMVDSFSDAYLDKLEGKLEPDKMPYMNFTDATTVIKSLDNIQAIGYKGKPATLDAFARTLGVSYQRDKDGNIDYSTIKDLGQPARDYEEMGLTRIARAFQQLHTGKAGNETILSTNSVGRDAIKGNLEGRYLTVQEGMKTGEIVSHLVTQSVLQVKHGPDDVAVMRRTEEVLPMLDRGHAVYFDKAEDRWRVAYDKDTNKPVNLTPSEFRDTLLNVYNNPKSEGGMGFNLSPEIAQIVADFRTDPDNPSRVMDITSESRMKRTPVLQQLAYKGIGKSELNTLHTMAQSEENIFCVPGNKNIPEWNNVYVPENIALNIEAAKHNEANPDDIQPMTPISKAVKGPRQLYSKTAELYAHTYGGSIQQTIEEPSLEEPTVKNSGASKAESVKSDDSTKTNETTYTHVGSETKQDTLFVASQHAQKILDDKEKDIYTDKSADNNFSM